MLGGVPRSGNRVPPFMVAGSSGNAPCRRRRWNGGDSRVGATIRSGGLGSPWRGRRGFRPIAASGLEGALQVFWAKSSVGECVSIMETMVRKNQLRSRGNGLHPY